MRVTEIINFSAFRFVPRETLEKAAMKGTSIHDEIESFLVFGSLPKSEQANIAVDWIAKNVVKVLAIEPTLVKDDIIGHPDLIAVLSSGKITVIDWKTGQKNKTWPIQLAAYRWLAEANGYNIDNCIDVALSDISVKAEWLKDYKLNLNVFFSCLNIFRHFKE